MPKTRLISSFTLALCAACGDGPVDPPAGGNAVLVIAPGALLLPETGDTHQLRALAIGADGDTTEVSATFISSDPSVVAVGPGGMATGGAALGSAQIIATSGELTSGPILALRATPVPGTLLVADSQVVAPIAPVDPSAVYAPGWEYRVRLRGAAPAVGQVVLASGGAPIGGRVKSVTPAGSDTEVVLQLLTLDGMFSALDVSQRLSLEHSSLQVSDELRSDLDVRRTVDGAVRADRRRGSRPLQASAARPSPSVRGRIEQEFDLGPFTCKAEVPQVFTFPLTLDVFSFEIDPSLELDLVIADATVERLVVAGGIAPRISASPRITAALEAKAECKVQVATLILPIGGPLALIVGGQVPLGVGFEAGAKATFGNLGFDAFLMASTAARFGIDCAGNCAVVAELDLQSPDGYFKPVMPDLGSTLRFELGASAFGWGELTIGNQFLQALQFKAVELKAGLEQKFELAAPEIQAADPAYASSYSLKPVLEAKAAASLTPLEDLLRISIASLSFAPELPTLAQSPSGTFTITPASVGAGSGSQLGEPAVFTVTLPSATYLGAYAIEGVEIRWHRTIGQSVSLEPGRPGCTDLEASQDQLTFSCQTDFLEEHAGAQTFYAFLKTRIFGVPVPVPLEIAADGKATVTVTGGAVSVTPATVTLLPGQTQTFTASVAGGGNQTVTWSATGGTFTVSGNSLEYTAGAVPGTYAVTATGAAAPNSSASAAVTISAPAGGSVELVAIGGFAETFLQFPDGIIGNDVDELTQTSAFQQSRQFTAQSSHTWSPPASEWSPGSITASASSTVSYQITGSSPAQLSVTVTGTANASSATQAEDLTAYGGKGEVNSADLWIDFEVQGTMTITLSGQVSSSGDESPRAYVALSGLAGPLFYSEGGAISTSLTLGPGRYFLRGDIHLSALSRVPDRPTSAASGSFAVTMMVTQ